MEESLIGDIKGETRSLDYSTYRVEGCGGVGPVWVLHISTHKLQPDGAAQRPPVTVARLERTNAQCVGG